MISLFAAVLSLGLLQDQSQAMAPRVLLGGPHTGPCDSITVRDGHIVRERVTVDTSPGDSPSGISVTWDGSTRIITTADEKASRDWMETHSLLSRLSLRRSDLYWEGRRVDLGKVRVTQLYQAIPWPSGVLIYGRTFPRRGFFGSWPFKGHFIEVWDLEPYCAIYFDLHTLKGEDLWLNGKVQLSFFVFPIPN